MKKIDIFFVLLLTVLPISAQVVDELSKRGLVLVGRFDSHPNYNNSYSVRVILSPKLERKVLLIDFNNDKWSPLKLKYMRIEEQYWEEFEKQMTIVEEKYEKWSQIATMNNEKNFKKTIPANFEHIGIWSIDNNNRIEELLGLGIKATSLYAVFEVEDERCYLHLVENDSGKSGVEFLTFYTPKAFHNLCQLIRKENAMHNLDLTLQAIEQEKAHAAQYD